MFHAQQQQQQRVRHGAKVTPAPSVNDIEAFRARQRMQIRHSHHHGYVQQDFQHPSFGNQADAHWGASTGGTDSDGDDRVRKLSLAKRLQQQVRQQQQQQQQSSQAPKMPNFGGRQFDAYSDECLDMPSPVPFETHALFNAFDYGNAPEAFDELRDNNNSSSSRCDEHNMFSHEHHGHHGHSEDEKSLWRRRFAADDAHLRRSPKLGKVALWDAPADNQFSHMQHQRQYVYPHHYQHHQHAPPPQQQHPFYQHHGQQFQH